MLNIRNLSWLIILLVGLGLFGKPPILQAAGIHYVASSGTDSGNCDMAFPCRTVQQAIFNAADGDEIRVAAGSYTSIIIVGKNNLTIQGGFTTANWQTATPDKNITTIDAQGGGRVVHLLGGSAMIRGFRITGGNVGALSGAGIFNENGTLTVEDSNITNNETSTDGGGIASNGSLILRRNRIYNNRAGRMGGGLFVSGNSSLLESNFIYHNSANNDSGGGIYVNGGTVSLAYNTLYDNHAVRGGGVYVANGTTTFRNNLVISNVATIGGGIFGTLSVAIVNNDFYGNSPTPIEGVTLSADSNNRLESNPLFVDPLSFDLHLSANSPAIDAADSSAPASDIDQQPRPFGSAADRGADEYVLVSRCYARLSNGRLFGTVQEAIESASNNSLIQVAGYCGGVQTRFGLKQVAYLNKTLTMRGGYTLTDWIAPLYGPTILDAQGQGRVIYMANSTVINPVIENLHLKGGSIGQNGAGVYLGSNVNATLRNNVIVQNIAALQGGGIYNEGSGNALIQHNTIYGNIAYQGGGICAGNNGIGLVTVQNSVMANNQATSMGTSGGGLYDPTGGRFRLSYNNFYNNTPSNYGGLTLAGNNDMNRFPGFVDAVNGNFHLTLNSGLINAADPTSSVTTDFEGQLRPLGSQADIGADESPTYLSISMDTPPPVAVMDANTVKGQPVTFTHTITNLGNIGTASFVINATNNNGWPISLIGPSSLPVLTLAQDGQATFQLVVLVPFTISEVNNRTFVTATSTSYSAIQALATDAIGKPGLTMTSNAPRFANPAQVFTLSHVLTNTGGLPDTVTFTHSGTIWLNHLSFSIDPGTAVKLEPGQAIQLIVEYNIPRTAPVGLVDELTILANSSFLGFTAVVTDTVTINALSGDRYVTPVGTNVQNNCVSPSASCQTIGYALKQAIAGDTVIVAQGTYSESNLTIDQAVNLLGGYTWTNGTFSRPSGALDPTKTIINATGGRGLLVDGQALIEGFTIKNGNAPGVGGGIYVRNYASPLVRHLIIQDCRASHGGGIYLEHGNSTLQDIEIKQTTANGQGGGIYLTDGNPTLKNINIVNAVAVDGGGIYNQGATITAEQLKLTGNQADNGGGIYQANGNLTLQRSQLGDNRALNNGGGLYGKGNLTVQNSFIYGNVAGANGGGVYHSVSGSLNLTNNSLVGNQANRLGGAIFDDNSSWPIMMNNIFAQNSANNFGGVYVVLPTNYSFDYNNFWQNQAAVTQNSNAPIGQHSLTVDPFFQDMADEDFHLAFDSPMIDAADPNSTLTVDFDGNLRPSGQGFDIGAVELNGCLARVIKANGTIMGPFGILQQAIDAASSHDTVQVSGTCWGARSLLVGGQLLKQTAFISKPLKLAGGYNSQFSNNPLLHAEPTVLDALGQGRVVMIEVLPTEQVELSNLTLIAGQANALGGGPGGADAGGGVYLGNGTAKFSTVVISNSRATYGGGVYLGSGGKGQATNVTMGYNQATSGGGFFLAGGSMTLSQTVLISNIAVTNGGGGYNVGGTMEGQLIQVTDNQANNGAGFYNDAGSQTNLQRSMVLNNHANNDGGGIYLTQNASNLSLINTLVVNNAAAAGNGGGLYSLSSKLTIRHDTFYGNMADTKGGGIFHNATSTGGIINSSLLIDNIAPDGSGIYNGAAKPGFAYNDLFGVVPDKVYGGNLTANDGAGNIAVSPEFISTSPTSPDFLNISTDSAVADKGDPTSPVVIDFKGNPRPANQNVDMGAYEPTSCYVRIKRGAELLPLYGKIQTAIAASQPGDELRVAGTCSGVDTFIDGGQSVKQTIFLSQSLTIMGGYTVDNWTTADPIAHPTIIEALGQGRVVYIANSAVISLVGLSLVHGNGDNGGAVLVKNGQLTMQGCVISDSHAINGGGLYHQAGTVNLSGNQWVNNKATHGGAIYNGGGTLTVNANTLQNNSVSSNGGAIYHNGGTSQIQNNIIWHNLASESGGGLYNGNSGLTVWHNTIVGNMAARGGGLFTLNDTPSVVNNIFAQNNLHSIYSEVAYKCDYNDAFPATNAYGGGATAESHSLTVDPLFSDAASGDFHLSENSPMRDKGNPSMTLRADFDSPPDYRPGEQGFDLGADERGSCLTKLVRTNQIFASLQEAIDTSLPDDEILVSASECKGVHAFVFNGQTFFQTVHIAHRLTLRGGFSLPDFKIQYPSILDSGISKLALRFQNATIINPQGQGSGILIANSAVVTLERLVIMNGKATAGGGIYFAGAQGNFNQLGFYNNEATNGGAIYQADGTLRLQNNQFHGNSAEQRGGAIYNLARLDLGLGISPSPFEGEGWGGGKIQLGSDNQARYGGFLYNAAGVATLKNNELANNQAEKGGAIYNAPAATIVMESNRIHANVARNNDEGQGGGFYNAGTATVDLGNHFYDNVADRAGGGLYQASGKLTLYNSLLYRNEAKEGAAIFVAGGNSDILHNTFYKNIGQTPVGLSRGGAIFVSMGDPVIKNNIFDTNSADNGTAIYGLASALLDDNNYWPANANNQVGGSVLTGTTNFNQNPLLVNGDGGDFHLQAGSPLINQAQPSAVGHDMEESPRPINAQADIGADEFDPCLAQWVRNDGTVAGKYGQLQTALDQASNGDTIRLAEGSCDETIVINKSVTLSGSWVKNFQQQLDLDTSPTASTINASNSSRVVTIKSGVGSVRLSRLSLINGNGGSEGGGLWSGSNELFIDNVVVLNSRAVNGGAVFLPTGVKATFSDVMLKGNQASNNGGGLYLGQNSHLILLADVTIFSNYAVNNGGGLYNASGSHLESFADYLLNNSAGESGGGLYNDLGSLIELNGGLPLQSNQAKRGGGIYQNGATLKLGQKQIINNLATNGEGGGIYALNGRLELTNLGLYQNTATSNGGGLYQQGSSTSLVHATIRQNKSQNGAGGGLYNSGGTMAISGTIVASNRAAVGGSGIHTLGGGVQVDYSLQWDNSYSGVIFGKGNQLNDPRFVFNSGGDLSYLSPAIEAMPNLASGVTVDGTGDARPQLCAKDMGQDEYGVGVRGLTWLTPTITNTVANSLNPGEVVTVTFGLRNDSEHWLRLDDAKTSRGKGTGYTETVMLTLDSSQKWAEIVDFGLEEDAQSKIQNLKSKIELGPGQTVEVPIRIAVPLEQKPGMVELTKLRYTAQQCNGGATMSGSSEAVRTEVMVHQTFLVGPENSGNALPGQTITYQHTITNSGNVTDSYLILAKTGFYARATIITPAAGRVTLSPEQTTTVVMSITVNPETAAGLVDTSRLLVQSISNGNQKSARNDTTIGQLNGTRYVSLDGTDSLVNELDGGSLVDWPDNNCTQPLVGTCRTLQQAMNQAQNGDLIKIAEGTYLDLGATLYRSSLITATAFISKSVTLQGGYQTTNWQKSPPDHPTHPTILDPQGQGRAIYATTGISLTLDCLTLRHGLGTEGGSIYNEGANLTLESVQLADNQAALGGGIYQAAGSLTLNNSLLYDNQASYHGGAVYVKTGGAIFQNNTFHHNQAMQRAGAIYMLNGSLLVPEWVMVSNTIFANNVSGNSGGAVRAETGQPTLTHNLYFNNMGGDTGGTVPVPLLWDNVLADPKFGNPGSQPPDLSLQISSPARDMGTPTLPSPESGEGRGGLDIVNHSRLSGLSVDIGAYEFMVVPGVELAANTTVITEVGQIVVISHTLKNTGQLADTFAISYTSSRGWINFMPRLVTLNPNEIFTFPITITVPMDAAGLSEVTTMIATSQVTVAVSAAVVDTIFVAFKPRLLLAETQRGHTKPLQPITYTHRITNIGTGFDSYAFSYQAPPNWEVDIVPASVSLPVSGSETIWVKVTPPDPRQAISGTVGTTLITASSQYSVAVAMSVAEMTTIDRVFSLTLATNETRRAWPGESVTTIHNLVNQGNFTETIALTFTSLVSDWATTLNPTFATLAPGQAETVLATVIVPDLNSPLASCKCSTMLITATLLSNESISATVVNTTTRLERSMLIAPPYETATLPDETVAFTHWLTNTGNLVISESMAITITENEWPNAVTIKPKTVTLADNDSAMITVTVKIPHVLSGTAMAIPVTAFNLNDPNTVAIVTDTVMVKLRRGVALIANQTGNGQLNQTVVYTHLLVNQSNYPDTFAISSKNDLNWPITQQLSDTYSTSPITLGMNEAALLTVTVTISGGGMTTSTTTIRAVSASDSSLSATVTDITQRDLPLPPTLLSPADGSYTANSNNTFQWTNYLPSEYVLKLDEIWTIENTSSRAMQLSEGVHIWTVASLDELGQQGLFTDSWRLIVDQTAPTVPVPIAPSAGWTSANATFSWGPASDNLSSQLAYRVVITDSQGQAIITTVTNITEALVTFTPQNNGVHQWAVQAIDLAGNASPFSQPFTFTVDATPPQLSLTQVAPPDNSIITACQTITFVWTVSNLAPDSESDFVGYVMVVRGQDNDFLLTTTLAAPFTSTMLTMPLACTPMGDGKYLWTVWAKDVVGNLSLPSQAKFILNTVVPDPILRLPTNGSVTHSQIISLTWLQVPQVATYTVSLTPVGQFEIIDPFLSGQDSQVVSPTELLEGVYTWTVTVPGGLENYNHTEAIWHFTVDRTPPSVPIPLSPLTGTAMPNPVYLNWTASNDELSWVVGYRVMVIGPTETFTLTVEGQSSIWFNALASGSYSWVVQAIDAAGNVSAWSPSNSFTVNTTLENRPILLSPSAQSYTNRKNVTFHWLPTSIALTYSVKIDSSGTTLYNVIAPTTSLSLSNLADGHYTWTVQAIDAFSQTQGYTDSWRVTVDTTPPLSFTLLSPPQNSITQINRPHFDWADAFELLSPPVVYTLDLHLIDSSLKLGGGKVTPLMTAKSEQTSDSDLPNGTYTWTVQASDQAGNVSQSPQIFTVTIKAKRIIYLPVIFKVK